MKQAQDIENIHLKKIKEKLGNELNQKLALHLNFKLSGAIAWVTTVICWYKLQSSVIDKFSEKLNKFEQKRDA